MKNTVVASPSDEVAGMARTSDEQWQKLGFVGLKSKKEKEKN